MRYDREVIKNIWIIITTLLLLPLCTSAHAFGQNFTLPIPVWLYLYAGSAVVLVSFLFMMLFEFRRKSSPRTSAPIITVDVPLILRRVVRGIIFICAFATLAVTIGATVRGGELPSQNFASLFIWIIFYLGMTYVSVILGNVWKYIDPLQTVFSWLNMKSLFVLPQRIRYVPALLGFMFFIWLELLSGGAAAEPSNLFYLIIGYLTYTFIGVLLYGVKDWYAYADVFSVYFAIVARASPLEYSGGRIQCKFPFSRIIDNNNTGVPFTLFVFFMLSSTAFDGFRETKTWLSLYHLLVPHLTFLGESVAVVVPTIVLLISPCIFYAVFVFALYVVKRLNYAELSITQLVQYFVPTLIPIAIGYNIAHYFTLLLIQGQSFITALSDPFRIGIDIFGTSSFVPNIGIVGAIFVWHTQVVAIVVAHVVAIILSHVVAMNIYQTKKAVLISQIPMLILMVLYTLLGLWILSLPMGMG